MEIPHEREHQQIPSNHSSDIEFKDFTKLYRDYTKEEHKDEHKLFKDKKNYVIDSNRKTVMM